MTAQERRQQIYLGRQREIMRRQFATRSLLDPQLTAVSKSIEIPPRFLEMDRKRQIERGGVL